MDAPSGFLTSIRLFDSLLDVRYSERLGQWVVERKAVIPQTEMAFLNRRASRALHILTRLGDAKTAKDIASSNDCKGIIEEHLSAVNGRRIILFAKQLDRRIFDALVASDIRRYGGYSSYADELERLEQRKDELRERANAAEREDVSREAYDRMNFAWRKKDSELLHDRHDKLWN